MTELWFMRFESGGEAFLPLLSEGRRRRALEIKADGARRQTVLSYALLRFALFERYGIAAAPEFIFGEHGKPYLKEYPDVFFSLSHSADAALCAVSEGEIGADLQEIRRLKVSAARKFCTPRELAGLDGIADTDRELCRLWCIKESYSKLTGKGFSEGFCDIDADGLLKSGNTALSERGGFFIAVSAWEKVGVPPITEVTEKELAERMKCQIN